MRIFNFLQMQMPDGWDENTQEIVKGFIDIALEYITKLIAENQVQTRTLGNIIGLIPGLDDVAPGLEGELGGFIASLGGGILQVPVEIKPKIIDKLTKIATDLGTGVAQLIAEIVKDFLSQSQKPNAPAPIPAPIPAPVPAMKGSDSSDADDEDPLKTDA